MAGAASPDIGSGELSTRREEIFQLLIDFGIIVGPAVLVSPLCRWVASVWGLSWRMSLVNAYLKAWDTTSTQIEGAAQRVHEDTRRFEVTLHSNDSRHNPTTHRPILCTLQEGISGCMSQFLDALFTLIVFAPILVALGSSARPRGVDWAPWLFFVALGSATFGLCMSILVGRKLVVLEVQNQKVEAKFRTDLVILAESPDVVCGRNILRTECVCGTEFSEIDLGAVTSNVSPATAFCGVVDELRLNYRRLFLQFAAMDTWLSSFDQFNALLPYLLTAPLLFAANADRRITLGELAKITNAFGRVFDSLTVLSENWAAVNAFRAVVHRLSEFEIAIYGRTRMLSSATRSDIALCTLATQ